MLAVLKTIPKEQCITVDSIPEPKRVDHWVLIQVEMAGICGSDLHTFRWTPDYQQRFANHLPVVLGHEFTGIVLETGHGVEQVRKGDRVVSRSPISCGQCSMCLSGQEAICDHRQLMGVHYNGAMAEFLTVPAGNCHVLGPEYPLHLAALSEPLSIAYGAVHKAGSLLGKYVVVIGPGPLGYFLTLFAKMSGAARLFVLGLPRDKERCALFRRSIPEVQTLDDPNALKELLQSSLFAGGADVVFESSGSSGGLEMALQLVRKRGLIIQVGIVSRQAEVNTNRAVRNEVSIIGTPALPKRLWIRILEALSLLPAPRQRLFEKVISHVFPLKEAPLAFELLNTGKGMKIMLSPHEHVPKIQAEHPLYAG